MLPQACMCTRMTAAMSIIMSRIIRMPSWTSGIIFFFQSCLGPRRPLNIPKHTSRPKAIDEEHPQRCSFRQRESMRRTMNHLSVRLGLDLPDIKRRPDLMPRVGIELVGCASLPCPVRPLRDTYVGCECRRVEQAAGALLVSTSTLTVLVVLVVLAFGSRSDAGKSTRATSSTT